MKIIALGTGGWIPSTHRETSSFLVREEDEAILFDAGTGVSRLLEKNIRNRYLGGARVLRIMISHFHLDHVIGITWLPQFWSGHTVFYVPVPPFNEYHGGKSLKTLISPPFFGLSIENFPGKVDIVYIDSDILYTDYLSISLISQKHGGGSVGFRVGRSMAYCPDSDPGKDHVKFLKKVNLAFLDGMYLKETYESLIKADGETDHGSSVSAARIASEACVNVLGLIHIDPILGKNGEKRLLDEACGIFPGTFIPHDLQEWDL